MAVRPIVLYPDPVLLRATEPVRQVDDEIRSLVRDMADTVYAAPGVGLAANQIGVAKRVLIVDLSAGEEPDSVMVFINPRITVVEGTNRLAPWPLTTEGVVQASQEARRNGSGEPRRLVGWDGRTAERVVDALMEQQ